MLSFFKMTPTFRKKIKNIRKDCLIPYIENNKNKLTLDDINFDKSKNIEIFLLCFSVFILFLLFLANN
jgi:hypothetical protein